ncbi:MAG TPA: PH domain-containing protein [Blastocatellia bacterium]|nr:PH domain-containing protein [Blastocatellia bacterium]
MIGESGPDHLPDPRLAAAEPEFQTLDPRVVKLWLVTDLVGFSVLLLILLASLLVWGFVRPEQFWWLITAWAVVAAGCLWYSFWRPPRAYRAWGYRLDAKVLETRSGIFFKRTRLLPLSRLQHVDLERGPFERMYGLASLILHTAGTHAASILIPGLDAETAVRLRDHLVEAGGDDAV